MYLVETQIISELQRSVKILFLIVLFLMSKMVFGQNIMENAIQLRDDNKYQEAIDLLEENKSNQDLLTQTIFDDEIANLYGLQGNYEKAFELKERTLKAFKEAKIDSLTYKSLTGLSRLFNNKFDYETGHKYIRESLEYATTRVDSAQAISNLGIYYKHQQMLDSAEYYYQAGLDLYPVNEDLTFFYITYNNLALLEKQRGNKQKALDYYDEAISYAEQMGDEKTKAAIIVNTSYIYYDLKDYARAEKILNEQEATIMSKGHVLDKLNFDLIRYNIAEKLNKDGDAYSYYKRFRGTKDSVDNLKLNTKIAEFETKYETEKKDKEIALQEISIEKAKNQKRYLFFGLFGALWLGLFGTLYFWARNRYQKRLSEEMMRNVTISSMIQGQEKERMRIAQDLHDSLGGLLTTIKMHFERLHIKIEEWANIEGTENMEQLIEKASSEVRRISHNMAPRTLNLSGLEAAIGDLATEINAAGEMNVSFEWHGKEIPEQDQIMVYRIVQETCNNAMKHSKATNLLIQMNVFEDGYNILIEDDGQGFGGDEKQGMGLKNIKSRATIIQAEVEIDSTPGQGTSITVAKAFPQ